MKAWQRWRALAVVALTIVAILGGYFWWTQKQVNTEAASRRDRLRAALSRQHELTEQLAGADRAAAAGCPPRQVVKPSAAADPPQPKS